MEIDLRGGEDGLHPAAQEHAGAVDEGEQGDDTNSNDLPDSQLEGVDGAEDVEGVFKPNTVKSVDVAEEDRHRGAVRGDARATHEKTVEHVQKAGHLSECRAQVDVLAAGVGQKGAQLGKTQRTEDGDDARDDPRAQHEGRACQRPVP